MLKLINLTPCKREENIIKTMLQGIFSNYADSIYIANDYLSIGNNYVIISNYPDLVSQREVEKARIIANSLYNGNFPIVLNSYIKFEGEANIKYLPT